MNRVIGAIALVGIMLAGAVVAQTADGNAERFRSTYDQVLTQVEANHIYMNSATRARLREAVPGPILDQYELRAAVRNALQLTGDPRLKVLSRSEQDAGEARFQAGEIQLGIKLESAELIGDQGIKLTSVESNSFAAASKLAVNDRILAINDRGVAGMRSADVQSLLVAPGAPEVRLVIAKADNSNLQIVSVPRHANGGIGVNFTTVQTVKLPKVTFVDERGPAMEGGLRVGDIITSVDGIQTQAVSNDALTRYVSSGLYLSYLELNIVRGGTPMQLHVQRRVIEASLPVLKYDRRVGVGDQQLNDPRYSSGLITIDNIDWESGKVLRQLDEFIAANGALPGIVIDVRNAGGSRADTAALILARFMPDGIVLHTTELFKGERYEVTYPLKDGVLERVRSGGPDARRDTLATGIKSYTGKVVVVTDGNTAGAAAGLAYAFKDSKRGTLVGKPTSADGALYGLLYVEASDVKMWLQVPKASMVTGLHNPFESVVPAFDASISSAWGAFDIIDPFPSWWTWEHIVMLLGGIVGVPLTIVVLVAIRRRRNAVKR